VKNKHSDSHCLLTLFCREK